MIASRKSFYFVLFCFVFSLLLSSCNKKALNILERKISSREVENLHLQEELDKCKDQAMTQAPVITKEKRKYKGEYKELVNFYSRVSGIECDVNFLKINFEDNCLIRLATVENLNYAEILLLLEDVGRTVFFVKNKSSVVIYIDYDDLDLTIRRARTVFSDSYRECKFDKTKNVKTTKVPIVSSVSRGFKATQRRVSEIQVHKSGVKSKAKFAERLLDDIKLNSSDENTLLSQYVQCGNTQLRYVIVDLVKKGKYIQLFRGKSFQCEIFSKCKELRNLIVCKDGANYVVLVKDAGQLQLIRRCSNFNNAFRKTY